MGESGDDRGRPAAAGSAAEAGGAPHAGRRGIAGWLLFDWAAQPYYTLVTTFVFAPYFVAQVAADPASGQAQWGYAASAAGLIIALLSPALGAIADAGGGRKPWIAGFSVLLVLGSAALWIAAPGASVWIVLVVAAIATVGVEFATVFNNAMMPDLVPRDRIGRLSGTGWAIGYLGGLVSMALALGFLVADPGTGRTLLGFAPVFGLDPAAHEDARAAGPFAALWYLVFVLPLFLFTPDVPKRMPPAAAVRHGLRQLRGTLRGIRQHADVVRYLVSHLVYADGLAALFAFGGIYAAGIFGWSSVELGIFGVLLTITGAVGAFLGGWLDDRLGPKKVIVASLLVLTLASLGVISIAADGVFFFFPAAPATPGDGLFATTGERLYILLGAMVGAAAGPLQAASRSLMVRLSPPDQMTEFFGLHALSGKVTSFIAPAVVATLTAVSGSQRVGISVILVFFIVGGLLILRVRSD